MSTDGGLKDLFKRNLPTIHWQPVETWSTGQGVPDVNGCEQGSEFWVENKVTDANAIQYGSEQVGWIERRLRAGGRVFLAVRRLTTAGPRKGAARDEFYLATGHHFRALALGGLKAVPEWLVKGEGGPAKWPWEEIRRHLLETDFLFIRNREIKNSGHQPGDMK